MNLYRWWNRKSSEKTIGKLRESLRASLADQKAGNVTVARTRWEETQERWADKDRWRAAHPLRAGAQHAWYRTFGRYGIIRRGLNPRMVMNRAVWFAQRGRRGWSDADAWSMDSYVARVVSQMLLHLAATTHSWPGEGSRWPAPQAWEEHLRDLGARIGAWGSWDLPGYDDQAAYEVTRQAMTEFSQDLGQYWD